ncbi:MAG: tetratricopeptide repeat protein [Chloroflexota bacterium]
MDGTTVGRYQIIEEIGRGGMATVYRAFDPRFKRDVAIKLMTQDLLEDPTLRARFEREAQTIANLEHPAIVPVYDFGEEDGRPYLVMRLMTGGTLTDLLQQGPVGIEGTVQILRRVGSALERAHKNGIIHRDLKPSNIMFDDYGDAFLADFGIARLTESAVTLTGDSVIGTPAYMSPEQIHGDKEIDGRSDIYALGVICFEMLTGRRPYEDKTPAKVMMKHIIDPVPDIRQVNPDLPQGVEEVINRTMAKEPDERYTTATEVTATLETLASFTTTKSADNIDAMTVAASLIGSTVETVEPESTAEAESPDETEIVDEAIGEEVDYAETDIMMPSFVDQEQAGSPKATVAEFPEETALETEVAVPTFVEESTEPTPATPQKIETGRPSKRNWIIPGVIAGILLILVLAVGGGLFLASRGGDEGTIEVTDESPGVVAVEPTEKPTRTRPPEPEPDGDPVREAEARLEIFYDRVEAEDYDGAKEAINQAIELVPEESWYFHERAWLFDLMENYGAALEDINQAIVLNPDEADNYLRRAVLFRTLGDYEAALRDHRKSIELNRRDPYGHFELGVTLREMRDIDGALAAFDRAIELDPGVDFFYGHRGDIYYEFGDPEAALRDLERAVALNPDEVWYFDILTGVYAWVLSDFESALENINRAIELEPDESWRYNDRATILRELGDIDGALANHEEAIAHDPDDVWNYLQRAITYRDFLGDFDAAMADHELAISIDPENPDVYSERGDTLQYAFGDLDAALADYERAIELDPEETWRINELAILYRDLGDYDTAIATHDRSIARDPEDSWSYLERGYTHRDLGNDSEAALADFDKAIDLDPDFIDAYLARANTLGWDFGDYDAAFANFERCKELDPGYYWCYFDEGWMRVEVGDSPAAVANFERFLELVPESECPECQEEAAIYIDENS